MPLSPWQSRYRAYTTEPLSRPLPVIKSQHNQAIVDLLVRCNFGCLLHVSCRSYFRTLALREEESKDNANPFKIQAFSRAIDSVRTLDRPVRSGNDVRAVSHILYVK